MKPRSSIHYGLGISQYRCGVCILLQHYWTKIPTPCVCTPTDWMGRGWQLGPFPGQNRLCARVVSPPLPADLSHSVRGPTTVYCRFSKMSAIPDLAPLCGGRPHHCVFKSESISGFCVQRQASPGTVSPEKQRSRVCREASRSKRSADREKIKKKKKETDTGHDSL